MDRGYVKGPIGSKTSTELSTIPTITFPTKTGPTPAA